MWIAFDMDGTLFDCGDIIVDAYVRASETFMRETGITLPLPTREMILSVIGNTADTFFLKLFPGLDSTLYPLIDRHCTRELSASVRRGEGLLYDGVAEMMHALAAEGHKLLIASNGQHEYITAILETYSLDRYLAAPVKVVNYNEVKTKSDILAWYKKNLLITETFVMVGDRSSDLKAARDNNAFFIGCAFGHAGDDEVKGADVIVHKITDVRQKLPVQ